MSLVCVVCLCSMLLSHASTHNTMHLGASYAPHVEVYVSGSMRFVDTKGVIPPTAGEADEHGWSLCTDGTLRKTHSASYKNAKNRTPQLQIRSSHMTIAVSWNPNLFSRPRITRDALNKAYKSGKPAKIKARGARTRSLHQCHGHGRHYISTSFISANKTKRTLSRLCCQPPPNAIN